MLFSVLRQVISWICVLLRLHTRYRYQCLGWDDLFVFLFRVCESNGGVGRDFFFDSLTQSPTGFRDRGHGFSLTMYEFVLCPLTHTRRRDATS